MELFLIIAHSGGLRVAVSMGRGSQGSWGRMELFLRIAHSGGLRVAVSMGRGSQGSWGRMELFFFNRGRRECRRSSCGNRSERIGNPQ
jgi:hypothetical protein